MTVRQSILAFISFYIIACGYVQLREAIVEGTSEDVIFQVVAIGVKLFTAAIAFYLIWKPTRKN